MGLKFLYYIDTSINWSMFTIGIICVPFGLGGLLLTTPIKHKQVIAPWYHGTGIWIGSVLLSTSLMMPFARLNPIFLKISVLITFIAMIISSIGIAVGIDEFSNWFENPTVKTFGSDMLSSDKGIFISSSAQIVVDRFELFDIFHKFRVIIVLIGSLLGISLLLYRIVTLQLVVFDDFISQGYNVLTPEEDLIDQACGEKQAGVTTYESIKSEQPLLYTGFKTKKRISDLLVLSDDDEEEEVDTESYDYKITELDNLAELEPYGNEPGSIYDPNVFKITKDKSKVESIPTYTDDDGKILICQFSDSLKMEIYEEMNVRI